MPSPRNSKGKTRLDSAWVVLSLDFESVFKEKISNKFSGKIKVEYAFQDINFLPEGYSCPNNREKPWGTAHAILSAQDLIHEPFVVINGDDFYGMNTFKVIADYYNNGSDGFSMVSFQLGNTLSSNGSVSRGLCTVVNNKLETVVETHGLKRIDNHIIGDSQKKSELVRFFKRSLVIVNFYHISIRFVKIPLIL